VDWAQYWSRVFKLYNPYGDKYCTVDVGKFECKAAYDAHHNPLGMSWIIQQGLGVYAPR
jgi:hypothetical protein